MISKAVLIAVDMPKTLPPFVSNFAKKINPHFFQGVRWWTALDPLKADQSVTIIMSVIGLPCSVW